MELTWPGAPGIAQQCVGMLPHEASLTQTTVARPGRLELPTLCLEGRRSIQLSYGRAAYVDSKLVMPTNNTHFSVLTS